MKLSTLRDVLKGLRQQPRAPRDADCPLCGAALIYLKTVLTVFESEENVEIFLGFCEHCDGLPVTAGLIQ